MPVSAQPDWKSSALKSAQPSGAEDHRQRQEQGQAGPGETVQCCFRTAGAAEHRAATGGQAAHAIPLGAVEKHQDDQQHTAADPAPGQN